MYCHRADKNGRLALHVSSAVFRVLRAVHNARILHAGKPLHRVPHSVYRFYTIRRRFATLSDISDSTTSKTGTLCRLSPWTLFSKRKQKKRIRKVHRVVGGTRSPARSPRRRFGYAPRIKNISRSVTKIRFEYNIKYGYLLSLSLKIKKIKKNANNSRVEAVV